MESNNTKNIKTLDNNNRVDLTSKCGLATPKTFNFGNLNTQKEKKDNGD